MSSHKIIPAIWFSAPKGEIAPIVEYYAQVFGSQFASNPIVPLGDTPSGHAEMCEVSFFDNVYSFMCTEIPHNELNDSFAIIVNCEDQNEIDTYWNYFTKEGKESQCGWCVDKWGLRWQIIPKNFGELMAKPNSWQVMMGQKKIVIEEYLK